MNALARGGITAVLGPSGCGKTTLLRLIAGFLQLDSGEIRIGGRVVAGDGTMVAPQRRHVGYVAQEGALFPHLDVAANIGFGLARGERVGARVDEVLDLVALPRALRTRWPRPDENLNQPMIPYDDVGQEVTPASVLAR